MTLRAAVCYSETAEDENTASMCVVNKRVRRTIRHSFIHCGNHGALCVISNASTDL